MRNYKLNLIKLTIVKRFTATIQGFRCDCHDTLLDIVLLKSTIEIRSLAWDQENEAHIWERHHRTRAEVEEVCLSDPNQLYTEDTHDNRLRIIGPRQDGSGRLLVIIVGAEGEGVYYVVTANPPNRQEIRRYNAWKAGKGHE